MRYFVKLSYLGTAYHGWQYQPNAVSVQEKIESAVSIILQARTTLYGAGRTDNGVHAKNFIAHFEMTHQIFENDLNLFVYKLNSLLPKDISIHEIHKVNNDAHARFDAKFRTYQYFITIKKDPFHIQTAWYRLGDLDLQLLNKACNILLSHNDFTSFTKLHTETKTNICNIMHAKWKQEGHIIVFEIKANRFLRNMVRAIVGTMIDVGRNKISINEFTKIIESKNRNNAGLSAPAEGLFLMEIGY